MDTSPGCGPRERTGQPWKSHRTRVARDLRLGPAEANGLAFDLGTPSDRDRAIEVLRRAVELGVNHIDTAAFYFSSVRSANELINSALAPYPKDLVIATKVGPGRDPSGAWLRCCRSWTR